MTIRFNNDKNGRKVAFRQMSGLRWVRMNLEEAELLVETGGVSEVLIGPKLLQPGGYILSTEKVNGITFHRTAVRPS